MAKDWGFIEPDQYGDVRWPFSKMEEGDYFRVRPEVREPRKVTNMVTTRAYQLGRKFSISTARDGTVTVYRGSRLMSGFGAPTLMKYNHFCAYFWRMTQKRADDLPWSEAQAARKPVFKALDFEIREEGQRAVMTFVDRQLFGVELLDDGVRLTPLAEDVSEEQWAAMRLLSD